MSDSLMDTEPLTAIPADDAFVMPASVSQKRFWLLEQMTPGNTALNIPIAFEITGPLDAGVLKRALQAIVDRHEILRTRFELIDGEPHQIIAARAEVKLEYVPATSGGDRNARVREVMDREAAKPVDFNRAPLFNAALLKLSADDHVLMITQHHIVSDGWSNGILIREVAAFYDALRHDEPATLPPLAIQYADYVLWQDEWLKTPEFRQQLDYWRTQLADGVPLLDFPTDFPRQVNQTPGAILEARLLPLPLTESLKRVGQEEGATLFMIFLSAYVALLHRYTGQPRLLLGTTAANRNKPELEHLVGLFANLLVLPADIADTMTFRDLLQRQRDQSLSGFANHEAPFELVLQELQQEGGAKLTMQTHFLFQRAFMQPVTVGDMTFKPLHSVSPGSTFELTFGIVERAEGIRLQMEYRTSLYRGETIRRFLQHFQQLLEAVAAHPETPLDELPLFAEGEREKIETRLAASLQGGVKVNRDDFFAELDRQLEAHLKKGQGTFATARIPAGVALAAFDAAGTHLSPVDIPGRIHVALSGAAAAEATPFLGRNTEGGGVELWGRKDDIVNIQGFRFNQRALDVQLRMHPQVANVAISVTNRVLVQVVLKDGAKIAGAELRDWLKGRVSDYLLPATIRVVPAFERDAEGVLVPEPEISVASTETSKTAAVPLQGLVQQQLIEIWQRLLKRQDLTPDSNFFECGGNSFLALRMMTEAEKVTRQTLPLSLLLRGATVRDLACHILEGANEKSGDVIAVQKTGSRPPLFFLHGDWIGGGFYCDRLSRELGEDQPVYALPPYHMREEKVASLPEMAAFHIAALRKERPHGPYVIGGYCIGATVAIEVGRQLVAEGETVVQLFLLDLPLWGGVMLRGLWPWTERVGKMAGWNLEKKIAMFDRTVVPLSRWLRRPLREKFDAVFHRLGLKSGSTERTINGATPQDDMGGAAILDGLDFSTYYIAYRLYHFEPLAVPATLLFPETMPPHRVEAGTERSCLEPSKLTIEIVPGNHTTCITEHIADLGAIMRRIIARS